MSSFLGRLRRKKDKEQNGHTATSSDGAYQNGNAHRDSLVNDHICIPAQRNSLTVAQQSADIGSGSDHEGIIVKQKPQLAFSLDRLLIDSSALSYFIQYLDSTDKLNLIKFWMHVEGFKSSFSEQIQAAQEYKLSASPLQKSCFDEAQDFVKSLFEYRYFDEFQNSVYYKKHELEVLSDGCSLADILKVQPLLLSFLEFIKEKEDHDTIQFLLGCDSFEANLDLMEDSEALGDAMALYEKYFSMQATNMIDLGSAIRAEMESLICEESGRPNRKAFRTAKTACFFRLHDKYLSDFLKTSYYHNYLGELQSFIDFTVELPRKVRNRAASSSDVASSTDSLTHAFSRHLEVLEKKMNDKDESTQTPTGSPSSSKRSTPRTPRSSRLAEVDEMGRYHALYDDSHSQTPQKPMRIKSTLRKYLDKNTLREEEIAEEVARTIIRDMQEMVASSAESPTSPTFRYG
ncbi:RGS domain-containing protein [Caenorhabditis elegans]|uniref:RGS domain-containing protein n=1 Tax=Caenorhabditis elegans TaxID=6239 RepID=A9Z1K0_CAEEL|nr:RGS domain-containing protein [Caenorhabditis elegans]CCD61535.1 RGS domain-containing protein [Caenorhabditis elegans]|eukprot:NP_001122672.1 Regulator of G-protein signaling rgs-5 [Caenorhabditis elegans]